MVQVRRVRGTPLNEVLFAFPGSIRLGGGLYQRFNRETASGRKKAVKTICVPRKFLQLVVTLREMRDI